MGNPVGGEVGLSLSNKRLHSPVVAEQSVPLGARLVHLLPAARDIWVTHTTT